MAIRVECPHPRKGARATGHDTRAALVCVQLHGGFTAELVCVILILALHVGW